MAHHPAKEPQHASPVAIAYAQSLLELANEQKSAESIGEELKALKSILDANPSFREVVANPAIGADERGQLLDKVFRGNVSKLVFNTIGVLNSKGRVGILREIAIAYGDLLDKQLGKVEVDLTVAQKLTPEQMDVATKRIGAVIGKNAVVQQYVNEDIIGGIIVRIGDKLIDASVRYQLSAMKEQLLASAPK